MFSKLEKSPLFRGLKAEEIETLIKSVNYKIRSYPKTKYIAFKGNEVDKLMVILEGSVIGEMQDFNGKTKRVDHIKAFFPLAPAFLFGQNNFFPIDAIAHEDCKILEISKLELMLLFQKNTRFLNNFLNAISNKTQFLSEKIWFSFSNKTIKKKISAFILKKEKNNYVIFNRTQSQLAEFFGIERPSFSRVFSEFIKDGILEKINNKKFKIIKREKLMEILN